MTSHVFYADHAHNSKPRPVTAPVSFAHQVLNAIRVALANLVADRDQSPAWLNATIRSQMSHRAQRLMRADY